MNLSLSKQPWYVQLGAFCALSLAGVAAFYFLYASPAQAEAAANLQKLQALRVEIDKGHATERRLPQFDRQVKALEARLEGLKAVLPEEKDVGDLLNRMQTLALQSNLKIKSFKPRTVVTDSKQMYSELPHDVEFDGTYHNLGLFLDRLSKLSRIINVADIGIKGKDKPEPAATVTAKCIATTYVLMDSSKIPAPATPAAKPAKPAK
jgi:type IV pilus assembly protein PilO